LFTRGTHVLWGFFFASTIIAEVVPAPPVPAIVFYAFLIIKLTLFVSLGFVTPLTYWRFDSLGRGLLFSCAGALMTELVQRFSPGHSTSLYEFAGKSCLLFIGFALALVARYEREIVLGPLHIELDDAAVARQTWP
jgi:hypothetical protein